MFFLYDPGLILLFWPLFLWVMITFCSLTSANVVKDSNPDLRPVYRHRQTRLLLAELHQTLSEILQDTRIRHCGTLSENTVENTIGH